MYARSARCHAERDVRRALLRTIIAAYYAARFADEVQDVVLLGTPVYDNQEEAWRRIWEMSPLAAMFSLHPVLAR